MCPQAGGQFPAHRILGGTPVQAREKAFNPSIYCEVTPMKDDDLPIFLPAPTDSGPFDIIGDVHGCLSELLELCTQLGYAIGRHDSRWLVTHPQARRLLLLGDLVDFGPDSPGVLSFVQDAMKSGGGLCVLGDHDARLAHALRGAMVPVSNGLQRSLDQLQATSLSTKAQIAEFLENLPCHLVLDSGRLVVAHAGLPERLHGSDSMETRRFAVHGESNQAFNVQGIPVRDRWAIEYLGETTVVYGHTPVEALRWIKRTICIDTGCVFGGRLTAMRYPEREFLSVPARQAYYPKGAMEGGSFSALSNTQIRLGLQEARYGVPIEQPTIHIHR